VRIRQLLVFLPVLLFVSTIAARADRIPVSGIPDPDIDISDPPCSECPPGVGLTFTFSADVAGGGIVSLQNVSGVTWENLLITTGNTPFFVDPGSILCRTNAFVSCIPQNLGGGMTGIFFSGVNTVFHGIPNLDAFTINLNDFVIEPGIASGSWGANRSFVAVANIPEPATLTLVGVGLAALVAARNLVGRPGSRT
jgi:hypothetical protein